MKLRAVGIWLLVGVSLGALSATTRAASVSLTPVADAMVSSAQPTFNYGGAGAFAVAASGLSQGGFESLLQFDLAGARNAFDLAYGAGQWRLAAAELRLNAANPNSAIFNPSAAGPIAASWLSNDGWLESNGTPMAPSGSGITWDTLPALLSATDESLGTLVFGGATSGASVYALAISPGLAGDALAGGLATLRLAPGDATVAALFNSRTFNNANNHPQLTLTAVAVPEPSTCVIVGLMLIGARFVTRHSGRSHSQTEIPMPTPAPLGPRWFAGAGRFGSLAAPGTRINAAELLTLVAAGAIAAAVVAFVHLQLRMPGSAILKATLPIVAGVALVPRQGAGTIASLSGMATAGILLALGAGRLPGAALTSLVAIGPAIDLAMGGAGRAGWRIYLRFAAAGLAANLMAFGVRWGSSLLEAGAMPPRMMRQLGWNALLSFALCGLLAGLVSAAVCFKAKSQHNDTPST